MVGPSWAWPRWPVWAWPTRPYQKRKPRGPPCSGEARAAGGQRGGASDGPACTPDRRARGGSAPRIWACVLLPGRGEQPGPPAVSECDRLVRCRDDWRGPGLAVAESRGPRSAWLVAAGDRGCCGVGLESPPTMLALKGATQSRRPFSGRPCPACPANRLLGRRYQPRILPLCLSFPSGSCPRASVSPQEAVGDRDRPPQPPDLGRPLAGSPIRPSLGLGPAWSGRPGRATLSSAGSCVGGR